jgi:DNA-binding response OmpR family regulator
MTRSVDNAIARLRKKIEPDPGHPRFVHTVHGDGYTITPEGRSSASVSRPE